MVLLFQLLSFSGLLVSAACFPLRISQALSLIKINPYHGLCHRWWDSQTHILLVRLKRTARGMRGPASAGACQLTKHSIITTIKITRRKRTCPGCSHNSHSWVEMIKPKQVISSVLNFFFVRFEMICTYVKPAICTRAPHYPFHPWNEIQKHYHHIQRGSLQTFRCPTNAGDLSRQNKSTKRTATTLTR